MRLIFWCLAILLAALFAISNREVVTVTLWPLPFAVDLPLYLVTLLALVLGFLLGEISGWIGARRWRIESRRRGRRIEALEREIVSLQGLLDSHAVSKEPARAGLPVAR